MKYQYDFALSYASEEEKLVKTVYHYLKAEGFKVFFAPEVEGQNVLSGRNQREVFYEIFGLKAEYVALFVSKHYVCKEVPMEEAGIALAKHSENQTVIPIYLDGTILPEALFDPKQINYFKSNKAAEIANHLASKKKNSSNETLKVPPNYKQRGTMNIKNNNASKQIFIQENHGSITL